MSRGAVRKQGRGWGCQQRGPGVSAGRGRRLRFAQTGLMRSRWSLGPGPPRAPDSVSGAGEEKGHCSRGAGLGGWPGAQHITLGGHSLGQQTPSRSEPSSEPSSQHGGRGLGRGPCGLSPPCAEGPRGQMGAVTSLSQRRWGWQGRPGVPGGAGSCEGQVQGDRGSGAGL